MTRRISSIQQGLIVQFEWAKYLMMGSGGRIEVNSPMTDDERRDNELHIRGLMGLSLAVQVKSAMQLYKMSKGAHYLYIIFDVRAERLISSPFFYYFFAFLDPKLMRLADPTFLIPSADFHRLAAPRLVNGVWHFTMAASMEADARDKWHIYRVNRLELGAQMLEILARLKASGESAPLPPELFGMPDLVWVHHRTK
jgi:hypothetical protein